MADFVSSDELFSEEEVIQKVATGSKRRYPTYKEIMEAIESGKDMEGKSVVIQTSDSSCVESDDESVDGSDKMMEAVTNYRPACTAETSIAKFNTKSVPGGGGTPLTLGGLKISPQVTPCRPQAGTVKRGSSISIENNESCDDEDLYSMIKNNIFLDKLFPN